MDLFVVIFSLFIALTGWLMKAQPNLISGYSTMSAEKKKNVDIQAVGNLFCKGFLLIGASMIALYAIFRWLLDMTAVAQGVWLAPIFIITPVLIVMAQKYDKNPRGGFAKYWQAGLITVIFALVATMIVWGVQPTKAIVEEGAVRFTGQYGVTVPLDEIARCELRDEIPRIEVKMNGLAIGVVAKGRFRLAELGRCRLLIRRGEAPYLFIETAKGEKIIFNSPDPALTRRLCETIGEGRGSSR
jgi:hypothetical protein